MNTTTTDAGEIRPEVPTPLDALRESWHALSPEERVERFRALSHADAEDLFLGLDAHDHALVILALPPKERRLWMRELDPDDIADVIQEAPAEEREHLLMLLDDPTRKEVAALLQYAEDDAGGLMNPRFASLRADMEVDEALSYLRRRARENHETTYYVYVLDHGILAGVVSLRGLFAAKSGTRVRDIMHADPVRVPPDMDQEALGQIFAQNDLMALPVVDADGRMKGIVTLDDIVDVIQEEATEDIQKFGGMEALDEPYLEAGFSDMVRKRAGWLSILMVGEMLTATAMSFFEDEIHRATVLALFVPLIISSGGNSGSQASTLVIRAMATGDLRLVDWWRVVRRELGAGLSLGLVLAAIGFVRIVVWQGIFHRYGDHWFLLAVTVSSSLIGVVMFGTLAGSMLPFALRRAGLDPASASAPFVATLVDVTGLIIYFTAATLILGQLMMGSS